MALQYYKEETTKNYDPARFVEPDLKGRSWAKVVLQFGKLADATTEFTNVVIIGRMVGTMVHLDFTDYNGSHFATFITPINKRARLCNMLCTRLICTDRQFFDGIGEDLV